MPQISNCSWFYLGLCFFIKFALFIFFLFFFFNMIYFFNYSKHNIFHFSFMI